MKVLKRFPDLPANAAHMGGLGYKEFMEILDSSPSLCLDTSFTFSQEFYDKIFYENGKKLIAQVTGKD